jgi:hypothetical protein
MIIVLFVLYGCETWSLALREEHRLRVFQNSGFRKIFGPKRKTDHGENCIMMNFIACILHRILLGGTCGTHGGGERCLQDFGWEARREETTGKT